MYLTTDADNVGAAEPPTSVWRVCGAGRGARSRGDNASLVGVGVGVGAGGRVGLGAETLACPPVWGTSGGNRRYDDGKADTRRCGRGLQLPTAVSWLCAFGQRTGVRLPGNPEVVGGRQHRHRSHRRGQAIAECEQRDFQRHVWLASG